MSRKINSLKDVALRYKNFFFDLDGVLVTPILYPSGGATKTSPDPSKPSTISSHCRGIFFSSPTPVSAPAKNSRNGSLDSASKLTSIKYFSLHLVFSRVLYCQSISFLPLPGIQENIVHGV